jgi:uncharacterized protein (TIGR02147 family)
VYEYSSYKQYIIDYLENLKQKGGRTKIANAINCHLAYLSKVLNNDANFTLEQAAKLNEYIGHNEVESEYFIYLVSLERAGNIELRKFFNDKIKKIQAEVRKVEKRISTTKKMKFEDRSLYFSHWLYSAIFVLSSIPDYQFPESMAEKLRVPLPQILKILDFLVSKKIIEMVDGRYMAVEQRIHLSGKSSLIRKHHTNWRLKAIQEIDDESYLHNLHFSTIYSMSLNDFEKIRTKFLQLVQEIEPVIADSQEEEAVAICFDLFKL